MCGSTSATVFTKFRGFFRNRDWTPIPCLQVPLEELLDDLMAMTLDAQEGGTTGEDTQSGAEGRHSEMDMA